MVIVLMALGWLGRRKQERLCEAIRLQRRAATVGQRCALCPENLPDNDEDVLV